MTSAAMYPTVNPTPMHYAQAMEWEDEELTAGTITAFQNRTAEQYEAAAALLGTETITGLKKPGMAGRGWLARECSEFCRITAANNPHPHQQKALILPFVEAQRITAPKAAAPAGWLTEGELWAAELGRLIQPEWWARQIAKRDRRENEYRRLKAGTIRLYCSDAAIEEMRESRARLRDWMSRAELIDHESGEAVPLAMVAAGSIANPAVMRTELMVRVKGMDEFALFNGHAGRFITITAPSKYHRNSKRWGMNALPDFVGPVHPFAPTPREVQQYLCKCWQKCRAYLGRHNLPVYGIRVTEPHTDACPHWHLLAWFESTAQAKAAITAIRRYFLAVDGTEPGAIKNRVKTITMNPFKGGAVGYVAKYLCKNIDGAHLDTMKDREGQTVAEGVEGAERVKTAASLWGSRQFQFFGPGLPPVGLWRELRRVRELDEVPGELLLLWDAANRGNWFDFMRCFQIAPAKIEYRTLLDDLHTLRDLCGPPEPGEENMITDRSIAGLPTLNQYGEPVRIALGVTAGAGRMTTRQPGRWEIKVSKAEPTPATPEQQLESWAVVQHHENGGTDWAQVVEYGYAVGVWSGGPEGPPPLDLWQ